LIHILNLLSRSRNYSAWARLSRLRRCRVPSPRFPADMFDCDRVRVGIEVRIADTPRTSSDIFCSPSPTDRPRCRVRDKYLCGSSPAILPNPVRSRSSIPAGPVMEVRILSEPALHGDGVVLLPARRLVELDGSPRYGAPLPPWCVSGCSSC